MATSNNGNACEIPSPAMGEREAERRTPERHDDARGTHDGSPLPHWGRGPR